MICLQDCMEIYNYLNNYIRPKYNGYMEGLS